jgi:hypothetical protein
MTAPLTGAIAMSSNTGELNLGSGSANPDIIKLIDGGSSDSGGCKIGGNGGLNLQIQGGTVVAPTPTIGTDNNGVINGSLKIGTGGNNADTISLSDTLNQGGTAVANIVGTVFRATGVTIPQNLVMVGTIGTVANGNILQLLDAPSPNATVTGDLVVTGTALIGEQRR